MADLVGKLGQTIKGSMSSFGSGFKQAAISGNPALFGAALNGVEKGLGAIGKEFQKDREDRRRDRQFNEENQNEQRKLDNDILKSLRNIEKLLEAVLGGKKEKSGTGFLGSLLAGLTAALGKFLDDIQGWGKKIVDFFTKTFDALAKKFNDAVKFLKSGLNKFIQFFDDLIGRLPNLGPKIKQFFDNIGKFFDDIFKSIRGSKLGQFAEDIIKGIKDFFTNAFSRLKSSAFVQFFDDIVTGVKNFFTDAFSRLKSFSLTGFFDTIVTKLAKVFDVEIDLFNRLKSIFQTEFFNGRLIQSFDDLAKVFSETGIFGKFAATLGLVFETLKTGVIDRVMGVFSNMGGFFKGISEFTGLDDFMKMTGAGLAKALKALPIIGNFIMLIEGIFAAFDTEEIAKALDKEVTEVTLFDRFKALIAGILGSIFGLLDLAAMAIKAVFDIDLTSGEDSYQKRVTRFLTSFISDSLEWVGSFFQLIGGVLKLDGAQIKDAMTNMSLIVGDWIVSTMNMMIRVLNGVSGFILDSVKKVAKYVPGGEKLVDSVREAVTITELDNTYATERKRLRDQRRKESASAKTKESASAKTTKPTSSNYSGPPGSGATGGAAGKLTPQAQYALDYFINAGYTPAQAAGLVANLQAESGASLNTKAIGDYKSGVGTAFGIAQWRGDRASRFKSLYGKDVLSASLDEQLAYVVWELANTEKSAGDKLRGAKTEAQAAAIVDRLYERSAGRSTNQRMSGAGTLLASYRPRGGSGGPMDPTSTSYRPGGGSGGPMASQNFPVQSQQERQMTEAVAEAIIESPNRDNQQIALMQSAERREIQYRQEDNKYRTEREQLEKQFYSTLENGYKNILTAMAGGYGQGMPGSGRSAIQQAIAPGMQKFAEKIFGKQMGGQVGGIFTQLVGSYSDQIIETVIAPMFGGQSKQANRFITSLASGNKKNAMEDLIYGMTGAATGMRSALGYDEGAAKIAKELATLTGTPFSPLFNLDKEQRKAQDQARLVSDPIVNAQYDSMNQLANRLTDQRAGGGTMVIAPSGEVLSPSGASSSYYTASGIPSYGGGGVTSVATPGFGGPGPLGATTQALGNLGALFLGRRLGVDTSTFGGSLAQGGLTTAIQAGLTGQNIMTALQGYNMVSGLGRNIATAGGRIFSAGAAGGVQQTIGQGMASFGGGMSLGASGGYQNMANFGTMNTAGQVGYVAGVIGAAMTAKSISDAFSGGYKSGVGDAVAVIGSFFDPTGGLIAGAVGGVVNRLFGRKAPEVTDSGITGTLKTDSASLKGYTDILEKGGTYRSDKRYTNYSALPPELVKNIGDSLKSLTQGIKDAGKMMGLDRRGATQSYQDAYNKLLAGTFSQEVRVSLRGKSEEEIKEALQKMIEDFSDAYIRDAFGTALDRFQKEGERLFETFDRLTKAAVAMTGVTEKLRYNFSLLKLSADEFEAAALADRFLDIAGGVDKYAKDVQFYFENFYTKEEQLEYAAEKGQDLMRKSLESVGLDATMSVQNLTNMMGETFEDARKAYRKVVEDFIAANGGMEEIVRKGDPKVIEQLAKMQGELAQEYFATTRAMQELDRIKGTSKEALTGAARAIFMADMAAAGRSFAVGGITSGPKSGYGAILHGTEAVVPLPDGREIPVELKFPTSELGLNRTFINNIVGNGNASVRSTPTNVITSPPQATSGSAPNRVLSSAY